MLCRILSSEFVMACVRILRIESVHEFVLPRLDVVLPHYVGHVGTDAGAVCHLQTKAEQRPKLSLLDLSISECRFGEIIHLPFWISPVCPVMCELGPAFQFWGLHLTDP